MEEHFIKYGHSVPASEIYRVSEISGEDPPPDSALSEVDPLLSYFRDPSLLSEHDIELIHSRTLTRERYIELGGNLQSENPETLDCYVLSGVATALREDIQLRYVRDEIVALEEGHRRSKLITIQNCSEGRQQFAETWKRLSQMTGHQVKTLQGWAEEAELTFGDLLSLHEIRTEHNTNFPTLIRALLSSNVSVKDLDELLTARGLIVESDVPPKFEGPERSGASNKFKDSLIQLVRLRAQFVDLPDEGEDIAAVIESFHDILRQGSVWSSTHLLLKLAKEESCNSLAALEHELRARFNQFEFDLEDESPTKSRVAVDKAAGPSQRATQRNLEDVSDLSSESLARLRAVFQGRDEEIPREIVDEDLPEELREDWL